MKNKFIEYRDGLVKMCRMGRTNFFIHKKLISYFKENPDDFRISSIFFESTLYAHNYTALSHLIVMFEPRCHRSNSLTIQKYLNFIEQNQSLFGKVNPTQLKSEIESDKKQIFSKKDVIDKLMGLRNNLLFHFGRKYIGNFKKLFKDFLVKEEEIDELYTLATEIINRYSVYFGDSWEYMGSELVDVGFQNLVEYIEKAKKGFQEDIDKIKNTIK